MTADEFVLRLTQECTVLPGAHVLAAVSGGADSVALLCLLDEAKERLQLTLSCVHVEHGLRAEASLGDMAFVRDLCAQKHIPFYAEQVDVPAYARQHGMGLEEAARALRYACFERVAQRISADVVALAHHAMDQAETVLLHASRGSDLRGLCAMRFRRGNLIRPLLWETPQALRSMLVANGQSWREDESNADVRFARNRIRRDAIPALEEAYPGAVRALCRLAESAQRDEAYFERELDERRIHIKRLVDGLALPREQLCVLHDALLSRYLYRQLACAGFKSQNAQVIGAIMQAVRCGGGKINLLGGGFAEASDRELYLIRAQESVPETPLALPGDTVTPFGVFTVREALSGETGDGRFSQVIPEEQLRGAIVTQRRAGDVMIPFGKRENVKLKKLVIDAGVERPLRNSLPVIRRGETVLWAVTLRPSAYCRLGDGQKGMMVTFKEASDTEERKTIRYSGG